MYVQVDVCKDDTEDERQGGTFFEVLYTPPGPSRAGPTDGCMMFAMNDFAAHPFQASEGKRLWSAVVQGRVLSKTCRLVLEGTVLSKTSLLIRMLCRLVSASECRQPTIKSRAVIFKPRPASSHKREGFSTNAIRAQRLQRTHGSSSR